jgi:plasmid stability protein
MEAQVSLSIKDVPVSLADELRARAKRNHRSIQGELMAILEEAVLPKKKGFDPDRLLRMADALGLGTSESSVEFIREFRDSR